VLEIAESFRKLVSKDRFPKGKDFAKKCTRCLEIHACERVHFLRCSKTNIKTEIECQRKHWKIVSNFHHQLWYR